METRKNDNADKIINSLDGMQPAEAPGFFYSRLLGRMQKEEGGRVRTYRNPVAAWAFGLLLFFLTINITVLLKEKNTGASTPSGMESFAEAYHLNASPSY